MDENQCRELLANLQLEQTRNIALTEIKSTLITANNSELSQNFLKSPELLECFENANSEQTLLVTDILSICMSNLSIDEPAEVKNVIEKSLSHANPKVQVFGLRELHRLLLAQPDSFANESVILLVIKCLTSDDTSVGTPSIDLLVLLLPRFVHLRSIQKNLEDVLTKKDIVRCRLYEVAVKVGSQSPALLDSMEKVLHKSVQELEGEDILLQLNVLQVLSELALSDHGMAYLENNGVFDNLMRKTNQLDEDPLAAILIPGLMRCYGSIAAIHPAKIYDGYPKIISLLFDCLLSEDFSVLPVAYDTLGYIAHPSEGKRQIHYKHGALLKKTLKHFHTIIRNLPNELKLRLLSCLQSLFSVDTTVIDNQITTITQTWYDYLTEQENLNLVMDYIRNPFPDMRRSALALLKAIVSHRWGQLYMLNTGGFVEYILDRKQEVDKDVILEKYEIIRQLAESTVFDQQTQAELKRYVAEGAFFVQGVTEVAIEGAS
ncbi:26S proteasome non-ATPase regulatory subunit 5-like [Wyeomyia smithii]|uniref:26S proteasome non-ATPase regulatory subunit 5-like n=1 Tax=Wyeomyia smithii TaxID=174621 RepID=UPI002467E1A9|nr:26S proteasome non-ATPase regulatory subunit 5-like [Wyeomyia smithii]